MVPTSLYIDAVLRERRASIERNLAVAALLRQPDDPPPPAARRSVAARPAPRPAPASGAGSVSGAGQPIPFGRLGRCPEPFPTHRAA